MVSEMEKRIAEDRKRKDKEQLLNIELCCNFTSKEIMAKYLPKTKSQEWYRRYCIGEGRIPEKAVNGHNGGTSFYTKDKKIMRSGESTWRALEITRRR